MHFCSYFVFFCFIFDSIFKSFIWREKKIPALIFLIKNQLRMESTFIAVTFKTTKAEFMLER